MEDSLTSKSSTFILWLFAAIGLAFSSCSRPIDEDGYVLIDIEADPSLLPYQFVQTSVVTPSTFPIAFSDTVGSGTYELKARKPYRESK